MNAPPPHCRHRHATNILPGAHVHLFCMSTSGRTTRNVGPHLRAPLFAWRASPPQGSLRHLTHLKQHNAAWLRALTSLEQSIGDGSSRLRDFLIAPVQRVPRYEMLARELSKRTPEHHPDAKTVAAAAEAMRDTAIHLDTNSEDAIDCYEVRPPPLRSRRFPPLPAHTLSFGAFSCLLFGTLCVS